MKNISSLVALLFSPCVLAAHPLSDTVILGGFGSVSAAKSDNTTPLFRNREITDDWCYDCDSTLGLQLDWRISPALRTSFQLAKRPQDHYSDPEWEWVYAAYEVNALTIKAGRLRLPLFLMSEYYYVSYAYPWFRPPQDVYDATLGITSYDGISFTWNGWLSDQVTTSVTAHYGLPDQGTFGVVGGQLKLDSDYTAGLSLQFYFDDSTVNASYLRSEAKQTAIMTIPSSDQTVTEQSKETFDIFSVGIEQYWGPVRLLSEGLLSRDLYANWYVSLDYHWQSLTPYVTYSQQRRDRDSESYLLGLRYTLNQHLAVNAEWQYIDAKRVNRNGSFTAPPTSSSQEDVNLFTLGLSFQF